MGKEKKGTAVRTLLRGLFLAAAGALVGYSLYLINARVVGDTPLPMPFGYGQAVAVSGSMSPTFEVDALLIYHAQEEYREGDMVAFQDERGSLVTHRIIEIDEERILTKGDANPIADRPIEKKQILGKVIYIIPHVGKVVSFLQKPQAVIFILALLLAGLEWNYAQERKASRRRLEAQRRELERLKDERRE